MNSVSNLRDPKRKRQRMSAEKFAFANALTKYLVSSPIRNADLAEKVADTLNRGLESEQAIDELLMSVSKLVDSKLREALEEVA